MDEENEALKIRIKSLEEKQTNQFEFNGLIRDYVDDLEIKLRSHINEINKATLEAFQRLKFRLDKNV